VIAGRRARLASGNGLPQPGDPVRGR
jgi:hypothetical protein